MKFVYPDFGIAIDTEDGVTEVVVENQNLLYKFLMDIRFQIEGNDGDAVISDCGKILQINKHLELLTAFAPFEINTKVLLNKLISKYKEAAVSELYYDHTLEIHRAVEEYLLVIGTALSGSISFDKLSVENIIKAAGPRFDAEHNTLAETLIDFFELVREYDIEKMFILYNVRSIINDDEYAKFVKSVQLHRYNIILIEANERKAIEGTIRYIIDEDLCLIHS